MLLERLALHHFRNYAKVTVQFPAAGAYITGANGSGKTNLLEAIYFMANLASFRTSRRIELPSWGAQRSVVEATVTERATQRRTELAIRMGHGGRHLYLYGKETRDFREFMARFAVVAFHPGTMQVIKGGPGGRRNFIDRGIASLWPGFIRVSQEFQRALKQRNALVRSLGRGTTPALAVWTERFAEVATHVTRLRQAHVARLNRTLDELVQRLGAGVGTLTLSYCPAVLDGCPLQESQEILAAPDSGVQLRRRFMAEAQRLRQAEEAIGQTLFGPQRDDLVIRYRGKESRSYTSQGEQRLTAFLLVIALAMSIYRHRGHHPVVLLDDVVSELDERNRRVVFDVLRTHAFQVFITDVEERPLYRNLGSLVALRVRQIDGQAEFSMV